MFSVKISDEKLKDGSSTTPLLPGDIIIQVTSSIKDEKLNSEDFLEKLDHCMIYDGQNHVIHSSEGHMRAVRKHEMYNTRLIPENEFFCKNFVFRVKNEKLRQEIFKQANQVLQNPITKFKYWDERNASKGIFEFFRAFRTHYRIHHDQSISKKKGISCNNFVGLILKSAIISLLFPKELPEEIHTQLQYIETIRKSTADKKLDKVSMDELKKFELLVQKYILKDNDLLLQLYQNVKHTSLSDFVSYALSKPDLFEIKYLYYNTDYFLKPFVMDQETFDAVRDEIESIKISSQALKEKYTHAMKP